MRKRRKISIKIKEIISSMVLFFLYRAFKVLYHKDSNIEKEIDSWKELQTIQIKTSNKGPALTIQKEKGKIKRILNREEADITIEFKSIDVAFLMLTGQLGVASAYAQHRFTLKGDISKAMSFVRCVDIIESYLFPRFMTKRILKEKYKKQKSAIVVYGHVLVGR